MGKQLPIALTEQQRRNATMESASTPEDVVFPSDQPSISKLGRYTNQLKFLRYNVLDTLNKMPDAASFKQPVDPYKLQIPTYFYFIKYPMDLGTIRRRIVNKYYWSAAECLRDFQQMFANAYVYNHPESAIIHQANQVELALLRKLTEMPENEEEIFSLTNSSSTSSANLGRQNHDVVDLEQISTSPPRKLRPRDSMGCFSTVSVHSSAASMKSSSPGVSSDSSGDESNDSENGESLRLKEFKKTCVPLLQQQMAIIQQQMMLLETLGSSSGLKSKKSKKTKTERRKCKRALMDEFCDEDKATHKARQPPRKRTKSDPKASLNQTGKNMKNLTLAANDTQISSETKVTKGTKKSNVEYESTSNPLSSEELVQLQQDIYRLLPEDVTEIVQGEIEMHIKGKIGQDGQWPLSSLPPRIQRELQKDVAERLEETRCESPPAQVPLNQPTFPITETALRSADAEPIHISEDEDEDDELIDEY